MKSTASLRYKPDDFPYFPLMVLIHGTSASIDAAVTVTLASSALFSVDVNSARFSILMSLVFTMAPFILLAPSISLLVNKVKTPRIVLGLCINGMRMCGLLVMAIAASQSSSARLVVFPLAFVMLVLSKCYVVTKSSALPQITTPESFSYFSSRLAMTTNIVSFSVGSLFFAVAAIFSEGATLYLAFCVVLVCMAMAIGSYGRPSRRVQAKLVDANQDDVPDRDVGQAPSRTAELSLRNRTRAIRSLITFMCSLRFIAGMVTIGTALAFRDDKHFLVLFFVGATIASFCTNLLAVRINSSRFARPIMFLALGVFCVAAAQLVVSSGAFSFLIISIGLGTLSAYTRVVYESRSAYVIPHELNAQLMARCEVLMQLAWVWGAICAVISYTAGFIGITSSMVCIFSMWAYSSHVAVSKKEHERF